MRKPRLIPEWKRIAKRAWSMRLMYLAGLLTATEAVLPLFADEFPRGVFAVLTMVVIMGAMFARISAQKGL